MRVREQIARLVQFFRRDGLGVAVPLENFEDAHRGQRPPASAEDRLRKAPDLRLREPGEQPGSELGRQDGDPGDIPIRMKRDRQAAPLHLNVRGMEGGDLVGAPACGDQGEDSSVAQSNGFAGAHPAWIDALKKYAGVFFVEMHQTGSFGVMVLLPLFESTISQGAQVLQIGALPEIGVSGSFVVRYERIARPQVVQPIFPNSSRWDFLPRFRWFWGRLSCWDLKNRSLERSFRQPDSRSNEISPVD
jgi:hypothetical protein